VSELIGAQSPGPQPLGAQFLDAPRPRLFAHRGLAVDVDENTIEAFRAALAAGATVIETDVHASRDGIAVISHDPDLVRMAGDARRIGELSAAESADIRLRRGGRLATLAEALETFPDVRFNIDVKEDAVVLPTVRAITRANAAHRVLLSGFGQRRRRRAVRALRGAATSASSIGALCALVGARLRFGALVRLALHDVDAVQVPLRQGPMVIVSPAFIRAVHAAGREVHVWTINEPADMVRLLDQGVDGIMSDRCDVLAAIVANRDRAA
jgi:glycerophosphoryl diester phosphodiesterase